MANKFKIGSLYKFHALSSEPMYLVAKANHNFFIKENDIFLITNMLENEPYPTEGIDLQILYKDKIGQVHINFFYYTWFIEVSL
jgi:hypothetical protein